MSFREHLGSLLDFCGVCVDDCFSFFVLCCDFVFVCLVCQILPVSPDCPFFIVPSVFCNLYEDYPIFDKYVLPTCNLHHCYFFGLLF